MLRKIDKLLNRSDLTLKPPHKWTDVDLKHGRDALVEAVIAPDSSLQGKTLEKINFAERFGAVPLAIRHHGKIAQEHLENVRLSGGDTLLLSISKDRVHEVDKDQSFVVASEVGIVRERKGKTPIVSVSFLE